MIPNVINTTEKYLLGLYLHIPGKKKIKDKSHQERKTSTKVKLLCIKYKHKIAILEEKKKEKEFHKQAHLVSCIVHVKLNTCLAYSVYLQWQCSTFSTDSSTREITIPTIKSNIQILLVYDYSQNNIQM